MRNYAMLIVLVPEDEIGPEFSDGTMHVQICTQIRGEVMECAAMLHNMAADIMASIKEEISKGNS